MNSIIADVLFLYMMNYSDRLIDEALEDGAATGRSGYDRILIRDVVEFIHDTTAESLRAADDYSLIVSNMEPIHSTPGDVIVDNAQELFELLVRVYERQHLRFPERQAAYTTSHEQSHFESTVLIGARACVYGVSLALSDSGGIISLPFTRGYEMRASKLAIASTISRPKKLSPGDIAGLAIHGYDLPGIGTKIEAHNEAGRAPYILPPLSYRPQRLRWLPKFN